MSNYALFSGPYFYLFGQNTEIYGINHRLKQENTDQKKPVFGQLLRSVRIKETSIKDFEGYLAKYLECNRA